MEQEIIEFGNIQYSELSKDAREKYDRAKKLSRDIFIDF